VTYEGLQLFRRVICPPDFLDVGNNRCGQQVVILNIGLIAVVLNYELLYR